MYGGRLHPEAVAAVHALKATHHQAASWLVEWEVRERLQVDRLAVWLATVVVDVGRQLPGVEKIKYNYYHNII